MTSLQTAAPELRCLVCRAAFDLAGGEAAIVLRHVAYGYDFVHDGACLARAREWIFAEPGYDCAAFARDPERRRVLGVMTAEGWTAIRSNTAQATDPLWCWALIEHADGTTQLEGVVRDADWFNEPGGAEFLEAQDLVGRDRGLLLLEARASAAAGDAIARRARGARDFAAAGAHPVNGADHEFAWAHLGASRA